MLIGLVAYVVVDYDHNGPLNLLELIIGSLNIYFLNQIKKESEICSLFCANCEKYKTVLLEGWIHQHLLYKPNIVLMLCR